MKSCYSPHWKRSSREKSTVCTAWEFLHSNFAYYKDTMTFRFWCITWHVHKSLSTPRSSATFTYNERGFRACDVLSLCSLAVSTKSGGDFLGHKGARARSAGALVGVRADRCFCLLCGLLHSMGLKVNLSESLILHNSDVWLQTF